MSKQEIIQEIENIFPLMDRMQAYDDRMWDIQSKYITWLSGKWKSRFVERGN